MLSLGETKVIWGVDVASIVISKLVQTKKNSKNLIGYLGELTRPLVLICSKLSDMLECLKKKITN